MEVDCALLCDAVTIREGLLHILGGGVTRANRPGFPAPLGLNLALRILVHPTEADRSHLLEATLQDADGKTIAKISAQFGLNDLGDTQPGEQISIPLALPLPPQIGLPHEGLYSFELLIDGVHKATVPFLAKTITPPQGA